jgi:hypothetical protein
VWVYVLRTVNVCPQSCECMSSVLWLSECPTVSVRRGGREYVSGTYLHTGEEDPDRDRTSLNRLARPPPNDTVTLPFVHTYSTPYSSVHRTSSSSGRLTVLMDGVATVWMYGRMYGCTYVLYTKPYSTYGVLTIPYRTVQVVPDRPRPSLLPAVEPLACSRRSTPLVPPPRGRC